MPLLNYLLNEQNTLGAFVLRQWLWCVVGIADRYHRQYSVTLGYLRENLLNIILTTLAIVVILKCAILANMHPARCKTLIHKCKL